MKQVKNFSLYSILILFSVLVTACGNGKSIVTDVRVETESDSDGLSRLSVETVLQTAGVQLPALNIPIRDPRSPLVEFGSIGIQPTLDGNNSVQLVFNVSEVVKSPFTDGTLPNGSPVPVGGVESDQIIGIPIPEINSKAYLAVGEGLAMVGYALSIRQLDGIGGSIGSINLFPAFSFENGVRGVGGFYTSNVPGGNGVAVFVDVGALIEKKPEAGLVLASAKQSQELVFYESEPSRKVKRKFQRKLYRAMKDNRQWQFSK